MKKEPAAESTRQGSSWGLLCGGYFSESLSLTQSDTQRSRAGSIEARKKPAVAPPTYVDCSGGLRKPMHDGLEV